MGAVTGLNMDTSEELQVSNYGIGGHYEPHFDFARVRKNILVRSLLDSSLPSLLYRLMYFVSTASLPHL